MHILCEALHQSIWTKALVYKLWLYIAVPFVAMWDTRGAFRAHRYTIMSLLAALSSSITKLSFFSQYICGTILVTLYSVVRDWRVLRAGQLLFQSMKLFAPFFGFNWFPFHLFLFKKEVKSHFPFTSLQVFLLTWCQLFSFNLALPTFLNNNNIANKVQYVV